MTTCTEKHAKFQPTDDQWKCPKCGAGNNGGESMFYIDESPNGDCELLHNEDYIVCVECKSSWTGKRLSTVMVDALSLEKCPHCAGTGFIAKK